MREALWLRTLLAELDIQASTPITLCCDNQSAIALCKDTKFHAHTKHIDICYHFIHEAVTDEKITHSYMLTSDDLLTKGLARPKFEGFLNKLGLQAFA
jgi:hypothetical protein